MKLRKKILIFISIVAFFGISVIYILVHFILLNRFDKLDKALLEDKMTTAVTSYQNELETMKSNLLNYSVWDETYHFVESSIPKKDIFNAPYIKSNYDGLTYEINHFDMIALLNKLGQPVYGGTYNQHSGVISPLTPELLNQISLINRHLPPFAGSEDSRTGIVMLDEGPMLITLTPILNNEKVLPLGGTAIAGRMLNQEEIIRIGYGATMVPASSLSLAKSNGKDTWITTASKNFNSIHTVIYDLFGNPGIVITVEQPREIYNNGMRSIINFRLFFLGTTLLMCIASLVFANQFVLQRMSSLVRNIRSIGSSQDLSIRIRSKGKDEFSDVEHEFNRMLSSLEEAQEELRLQTMLDPLTQLPNRSLFFTKLNQAIAVAKEEQQQIALLFIDLDHFKTVNDTLGHDFGDVMLREIAARISSVVGQNDVVSRLGGDEFTILLADISENGEVTEQLSRIQEALAVPHHIHGHLLYNTASIGISVYPQNGEDANLLVKQADLAMFHVKESGRNNIFQYSTVLEESVRRKMVIVQELLSAAANNEFEVHYQPILSSDTLKVSKVEALLRWTSPTYGAVLPSEFIPLAETSASIIGIGNWVLAQVCSDMREFRLKGLELSAAVNISARQLMQPGLLEILLKLLQEYNLPASCLELEITESVLVSGDNIFQSLQQLRAHGFRISLDDFGTGFSSLSYLRRFPVDVIKIDRSFVSEITSEPKGDVLVKAIIELSHDLGLKVISEGIELQEQFDLLRQLGSDELQGYYISKPINSSAIPAFLSQDALFYDKK